MIRSACTYSGENYEGNHKLVKWRWRMALRKVHRTHTVVCLSIVVWVLVKAETYSLQNSGFLLSGDSFALLNQERKRYIILCFG